MRLLPWLLIGSALFVTVTPTDGGCSGTNLHWWVLEPLAHALGVHAWFREGSPLWPLVPAVPLAVSLLGLGASVRGAIVLRRRRGSGDPRSGLMDLALGALTAAAGAWAALQVANLA